MAISPLKHVPFVIRPEIRLVPMPVETGPQPIPENWPKLPAANTNVEIVEGFASKYLRVGTRVVGRALFWLQFLEFEGDTAHHVQVIDKPPAGKTVSQWLAEMEEMAKLAALIMAKQSEVMRHRQNGHAYLARQAEQDLTSLQVQVNTNLGVIPSLGNRLLIRASASTVSSNSSDASTNASEPADKEKKSNVPAVFVRETVSLDEVGELLLAVAEGRATPDDLATLIAASPNKALRVLTIYVRNRSEEDPDSPYVLAVSNSGVPTDGRTMLVILSHMANVDSEELDDISQRIAMAFDPRAMLTSSYQFEDSEVREDPSNVIGDLYFLFRKHAPNGDAILNAVDAYRQAAVQEMLGMTAPKTLAALKLQVEKNELLPADSFSLLMMGETMAADTANAIRSNMSSDKPKFLQECAQAAVGLLRDSRLSSEQKGMVVDLIRRDLTLAQIIQVAVMTFIEKYPDGANRALRQIYIANTQMGDYVLAEYDRRMNLPEVRAKKALDSVIAEKGRDWNKATFALKSGGKLDPLLATMQRGLQYADAADAAEAKALAGRWIDAVIRRPKEVWDQVQALTPEQDPSGFHVFTTLMTRTYDPVKDPFGFLLPHERDFWDQKPNAQHPTIKLLQAIENTVSSGEFLAEYAWLQHPDAFNESAGVVRQAATGHYAEVDAAAVRELMARSVKDRQLQAALLYWGASMPSKEDKRSYWARIPGRATEILEGARKRDSNVVGNILELIMRHDDVGFGGVAEMDAIRHLSQQRGTWIQILPLDYRHHRRVADLLVVGRSGAMQLVEVKNALHRNGAESEALRRALVKASEQLASSGADYKTANRVIFVRLATNNGAQVPADVEAMIRDQLHNDPALSEIVVEVVSAREAAEPKIVSYPNANVAPNGNGYAGPRLAQRLADRLVLQGVIKPEAHDGVMARLATMPAELVSRFMALPPNRVREAADRYGLGKVLR